KNTINHKYQSRSRSNHQYQSQSRSNHQSRSRSQSNHQHQYKSQSNHQSRSRSRSNHQYQYKSQSNHQHQYESRSNCQSRSQSRSNHQYQYQYGSRPNHQYQYESRSNCQSRSQSRSNHQYQSRSNHLHHQKNKPYVTHQTHYNNRRSQDSQKKTHSHSRSPSYNRKSLRLASKTQSKKLIHGIILSDSMASKCRMYKVNIPNVINVQLIARSGCNCEQMADWMASVEGTNDIAQLGLDLTLKRCQWLIEYTRRTFPTIKTIGWMKLSPRTKPSRFFSGNQIANLHRAFNERLYLLSKERNIDIIDAQLKIDDIRIEDDLHPTLSSGRQKFENAQRQWFARQAMYLSTNIDQQHTKHTTTTTMNNNLINLTNLQQQPRTTTGQVQQLNSTQPFIVNHKKSEKVFRHPCLPSQQLIKFYPHKLKHPNQLFRESTPPENIDKDKVFLIANLYYQYRHFEDEAKKWRVYETAASQKETQQQKRTIHFYHSNYERENNFTNNNNTIDREIPEVRTGPTSPRWSGNETFDSETNGENKEKETKKRKLGDTSLSPIGLNVRTREDMSDTQMDGEDEQEQVIEHYDPLTQSTPTGHNLNQSPNSSIYTQRVICQPLTTMEIDSDDVHVVFTV
ncbi:unnamed protein product, partial [Rotaria sordida]